MITIASYTAPLQQTQQRAPATSIAQNSFRILPIKVIFHFEIRWLASLKFKDALTENKKRKHLRGSLKVAKENQDWKKIEDNE